MKRKNYSGSGLTSLDRSKLRSLILKIKNILIEKDCINIEINYGFHFISGFFTSKSGQIYYIGSGDTRLNRPKMFYYRMANSYTDYLGDFNNWLNSIEDLKTVSIK
jgi:hypothetical protein